MFYNIYLHINNTSMEEAKQEYEWLHKLGTDILEICDSLKNINKRELTGEQEDLLLDVYETYHLQSKREE